MEFDRNIRYVMKRKRRSPMYVNFDLILEYAFTVHIFTPRILKAANLAEG